MTEHSQESHIPHMLPLSLLISTSSRRRQDEDAFAFSCPSGRSAWTCPGWPSLPLLDPDYPTSGPRCSAWIAAVCASAYDCGRECLQCYYVGSSSPPIPLYLVFYTEIVRLMTARVLTDTLFLQGREMSPSGQHVPPAKWPKTSPTTGSPTCTSRAPKTARTTASCPRPSSLCWEAQPEPRADLPCTIRSLI